MAGRTENLATAEREDGYHYAKMVFKAYCGAKKRWNGQMRELKEDPPDVASLHVGRVIERACVQNA